MNPDKFNGVWADFSNGPDDSRETLIEGVDGTTLVDITVARMVR